MDRQVVAVRDGGQANGELVMEIQRRAERDATIRSLLGLGSFDFLFTASLYGSILNAN